MFDKIAAHFSKKASATSALIAAGLLGANLGAGAKKLMKSPTVQTMLVNAGKSSKYSVPTALALGGLVGYGLSEDN
jgi:hypothetical protein